MLKRLIRTKIGLACLSWVIATVVFLMMLSIRWRHHDRETLRAILADHDGFISLALDMVSDSGDDNNQQR